MTSPQPQPPVQYVYVQREPTLVMPIFGWLTALFSFLFYPLSGTPLTLIAIAAWFTSVGLTAASFRASRRSAHWIAAASILGVSTVTFVAYFFATV